MGLATMSHELVTEREEGIGKGGRKQPRIESRVASAFGYGLKQVQVGAKHENELTVLVERERPIQEHVTEKRERRIRLGHC